ncbi:MAG: Ku protein [Actinomycetota bacterium]|nr:Ku protein [Actinomycetota bacterium]
MWKGAISFGLVSIPVRVFPATEEKTLRFNQLHATDRGRIRYKRTCEACGEEVSFDQIVKGYEVEKDRYIVLEDQDFDAIAVESTRAIDIAQFVNLDEIDPVYFQKSYYLAPEETGVKAYRLLGTALGDGRKVGIAKVAFRDKEHLAAIRVLDGVIVLETMYWPDEIRAAAIEGLDGEVSVRPQELQMAESLIENLTEPWDPQAYTDEYRRALLDVVERKAAGQEIEVVAGPEPERVTDLMEALKASVEATRGRAGDKKADDQQAGGKAPPKRKKARAAS